MEFLDEEEAWEQKVQLIKENEEVFSNSLVISSEISPESSLEDSLESSLSTLTIPNLPSNKGTATRRHSSSILKHGLEQLEENETDLEDKRLTLLFFSIVISLFLNLLSISLNSVTTNITLNTTTSDDSTSDIFLTLSVKELKRILHIKITQFSNEKANKILQNLSTINGKDELRDLCKLYIDKFEVQQLLLENETNSNSLNINVNSPQSNRNIEINMTNEINSETSTPSKDPFSSYFNELSSLSIQQIKLILKTRAPELSSNDSSTLLYLISTSVEKFELIQLFHQYLPLESDFERIVSFLNISIQPNSPSYQEEGVEEDGNNQDNTNTTESPINRLTQRKQAFRKMISLTAFDDGTSLRGMLFKKGRGRSGFLKPWNERFFILNYKLLTLRYYNISG